jgi:putative copper resistance protein D
MIFALASADANVWLSIVVKTLAYAATLVAAGSVLVSVGLRELTTDGRSSLRRMAVLAALAAAVLSVLRVPVRASFLIGGSLDGAVDPMMLWIVAESPLGASVIVRLVGLALIPAILLPNRGAGWVALFGALLTCASFALRGHALGDPRILLGALVTIHIAGLAFWIGAFAPLARAARCETPATVGALAHEFGTKALWIVASLVVAGVLTLVLLGAATPSALSTPYGQAFLVKLVLFAGVLGLAAMNKLWLTPELQSASPRAARRLRRSIGLESALVVAILATTAALTTVTSPPSEQARMTSQQSPTAKVAAQVSGDFQWRS